MKVGCWMTPWLAILWHAFHTSSSVQGFSNPIPTRAPMQLAAVSQDGWEDLVPDHESSPVLKTVLEAAPDLESELPQKGSTVTIEYSGSLWMDDDALGCSIPSWDTQAVLDCWLSEQQGLSEILEGPFCEHSVTGATLLDEAVFTEDFVATTLGVDNKIRCKKTIMAAKRLRSTVADYDHGWVFDATGPDTSRPTYDFVLGGGKTIRAMELLVGSMRVGERARVVARCDYGYGADGCRTAKGDVLVPPFCGLSFDVKLLSVE